MSKRDAALALAARGFKVFPIKPGVKAPPQVKNWPDNATSDRPIIDSLWAAWPEANIGISCQGMLVVDVDKAKGGDEALEGLDIIHGVPGTLTALTPSGGRHLFYLLPKGHPGVSNSVQALGTGLDIRSTGGYVVAAGSEVPAGTYKWLFDIPPVPAPDWLVQKLSVFTEREQEREMNIADAAEDVLTRAEDWLDEQPPAVEGQGGDAHTFRIACGLRDRGLSEGQAYDMMLLWNIDCSPPWTDDELRTKVKNAYEYAKNEPGVRAITTDEFPVVETKAVSQTPARPKRGPQRLSELAKLPAGGPGYLVKGLMQRCSYVVDYGEPGSGKTFVALDIGYHVAAGRPWMGHKVHAGVVLYVAYEGVGGLTKRAAALRQHYGDADIPMYVIAADYNLRELTGRKELGAVLAQLPAKPVLIVIDTFARAMKGGDENSAQDVGAFNDAVGALIESTGACVMVIHHSGKNKAGGARGSSALLGAVDTEIAIDDRNIISTKQRDIEMIEPIAFELKPITVGIDDENDAIVSCVVIPTQKVHVNPTSLKGNALRGWQVLCELRPTNAPITEAEWAQNCVFLPEKGRRQRMYDIRQTLRKVGLIQMSGEGLITRRME